VDDSTCLQGATVPLDVTGLPGISMRSGTSKEGMQINVQIVGIWLAESITDRDRWQVID
jgi:aspartyl-tRNA(Asn)/glutamyl-tRNA(Gln) amidotransferase subunit A